MNECGYAATSRNCLKDYCTSPGSASSVCGAGKDVRRIWDQGRQFEDVEDIYLHLEKSKLKRDKLKGFGDIRKVISVW